MEYVISSIIVGVIVVVVFLFFRWMISPFKDLKLNDQSYMYEKQDHLNKTKRVKSRSRKKRPSAKHQEK